jgi:hypothetical protein
VKIYFFKKNWLFWNAFLNEFLRWFSAQKTFLSKLWFLNYRPIFELTFIWFLTIFHSNVQFCHSQWIRLWSVSKTGVLTPEQQIDHDLVTNRHDVVKIFHHTISNELPLDSAEHSALQTETKQSPKAKANNEKMTTLMFDIFNVSLFWVESKQFIRCSAHGAFLVLCLMEMIVFQAQF